ncbi:2736_t:CDS:2 [Cetraspora pellucida]|uniref:2736_t:CDS:1 n=1 Tax=Cetraspora pellucida TaxID=1433469 RepID=A0ACA9MFH8_9GLOM|nr:2736_t:CDS:2 [Cetraspora pellucida]
MRDYPLPCGEPEVIKDPQLIEQKLQAGVAGFLAWELKSPALIKKQQIPFLPDHNDEIKESEKAVLVAIIITPSWWRSDCIYVRGELPAKFLKEAKKYQKYKITHHQQAGFFGEDNIFIYDNQELKSFTNNPSERKKLMEEFLNKQLS